MGNNFDGIRAQRNAHPTVPVAEAALEERNQTLKDISGTLGKFAYRPEYNIWKSGDHSLKKACYETAGIV